MPRPQNFVSPDGKLVGAPDDATAAALLDKGYTPESDRANYERTRADAIVAQYSGVSDKIGAFAGSALSAATFGLSDAIGADESTKLRRQANPNSALAGQIVGSVAPAFMGDFGGLLPAGMASRSGAAITELGAGSGLIGKTVAATAGGAFEGALQSGGQYISQVALGDKDLSAEGFIGSLGDGALIGGAIGGGASVAESTLIRAKSLFPKITKEAADDAHAVATTELSKAIDDGDALQELATRRVNEQMTIRAERDAAFREEKRRLQLEAEQLKLASEQAKLERQQEMTRSTIERNSARNAERPTRKTFEQRPKVATVEPSAVDNAAPLSTPKSALEQQLEATQSALTDGASLKKLSTRSIDDQMHDAFAQVDPTAADLIHATRVQRMAKDEIKSWVEKMKAPKAEKSPGVDFLALGKKARKRRGWVTKIDENYGERVLARIRPDYREEADLALENMMGRVTPPRKSLIIEPDAPAPKVDHGPAIVESAAAPDISPGITQADPIVENTTDRIVSEALGAKPSGGAAFTATEINEGAKVIGNYEKANADLVAILGDEATPLAAHANAQQYHAAVAAQHEAAATTAARATDQVASLSPSVEKQSALAKLANGGAIEKAQQYGAVLELLKMSGLDVPTARDLPVVGPLLSMYLRARALAGIAGRSGIKLPKSTEALIAAKSATTQRAITAAVEKAFTVGTKATKAVQQSAGKASPLMMRLFDHDDKRKPANTAEAYQHRLDELSRASQPGAVAARVAAKVPSADAAVVDAITAAAQRKYDFLMSKAPKATAPTGLLSSGKPWEPSRAQLRSFERYLSAAENPVKVFESAARGEIDFEGIETVKACYPRLYQEAQRTLIQSAEKLQVKLPYQRRLALSAMFGVAVDPTMSDSFMSVMQQPDTASQQPTPPQPAFGNLPDMGAAYSTRLDRRGA